MKRFHVHLHVNDLAANIAFYSRLFGAAPTRVEADYAKWMLEDPRVNFAISTRGAQAGLDHLGFQVDDAAELAALKERATAADMALLDEGATTCTSTIWRPTLPSIRACLALPPPVWRPTTPNGCSRTHA